MAATLETVPRLALTTSQVAEAISVSKRTVEKLVAMPPELGGIPTVRIGRLVRIHVDELERWLRQQRQTGR